MKSTLGADPEMVSAPPKDQPKGMIYGTAGRAYEQLEIIRSQNIRLENLIQRLFGVPTGARSENGEKDASEGAIAELNSVLEKIESEIYYKNSLINTLEEL